MYRPLIKIYSSNYLLDTDFVYKTLKDLNRINETLIPTLKLIGVQTNQEVKIIDFQKQIKSEMNDENFIIGIKGKYFQNKLEKELKFHEASQIIQVTGETNLQIEIPNQYGTQINKKQLFKTLGTKIENSKNNIYLQLKNQNNQDIYEKYSKKDIVDSVNKNRIQCQFILPLFQSVNYKNVENYFIYKGTIPIQFYCVKNKNTILVSEVIDAFLKEVIGTLKIMIDSGLTYRKVIKQNRLLLDDFYKEKKIEIKKQLKNINQEKQIKSQPKSNPSLATQNNNKNIVLIIAIILLCIVYASIKLL